MVLDIADYNAGVREYTRDEARRLTEDIRAAAKSAARAVDYLRELVEQAKNGNVHEQLGYSSWTAYLADVLGDTPMRLERDTRQEMSRMLTDEGMSTRAAAKVLGVSNKTVSQDVREVLPEVTPAPTADAESAPPAEAPAPRVVTGMDGKTYTPKPREVVDMQTGEVSSEEEYWDQKNAEQGAQSLGRALITLRALKHEMKRNIYLDKWLPRGLDAVPPGEKELITPANMRLIAGYLNQFATDMEKSK